MPGFRTFLTAALLAASVASPWVEPSGAAGRCLEGRYLVQGQGLVVGSGQAVNDTVTISPKEVTIVNECGAAKLKRSGRRLRARWPLCLQLGGEVRLKARLDGDCSAMTGKLRVVTSKTTRPFVASLSRCSDGTIDYARGEECDDANTVAGDGCDPSCTVSPRDLTATLTSASGLGEVLEQATVSLALGNTGGKVLFALTANTPFSLCSREWHFVQDGRQVDFGAEADPSRGVARIVYEGFQDCRIVSAGVTVRGSFEDFPPGLDLRRGFDVRYDFNSLLGSTCRNPSSTCVIAVP